MASTFISSPNDWTNYLFSNEKKTPKQMKIVSWNCNVASRKKFEYNSNFNADIYIIHECEYPAESRHLKYQEYAKNFNWFGDK